MKLYLRWCELCNCPAWWKIHLERERAAPHEKEHVRVRPVKGLGDVVPSGSYLVTKDDNADMTIVGMFRA